LLSPLISGLVTITDDGEGILRGDHYACETRQFNTDSGGSTSGEGYLVGTMKYDCKRGED
jgi:hypothetical protein